MTKRTIATQNRMRAPSIGQRISRRYGRSANTRSSRSTARSQNGCSSGGRPNRGVSIQLIVETPNRIEGQGEYDCLLALGDNVASACSVYYWPQENRAKDDNGKIGILHV